MRNKPPTDKRVKEELSERSNITILEAELTSHDAIKVRENACERGVEDVIVAKSKYQKAAESSVAVTGGKVDYIIANAGYVPTWDMFQGLDVLYVLESCQTKP